MAGNEKEIIGRKKRSFKEWLICKLGGIPFSQTIHQESIMRMETVRPEKIVVESAGNAFGYAKRAMVKILVEKLIDDGYVEFIGWTIHDNNWPLPIDHTRAVLWVVKMPREQLMPGEFYEC